jgi:uncharacterized membrane protein (UPF0127 family)
VSDRPPHFLADAIGNALPCGLRLERTGEWVVRRLQLALDSETRRRGLLGRTSLEPGEGLVIAPSQGVHTFGMRFAIDVLGVSREGRVVKVRAAVKPARIALALTAWAIVEMEAGGAARHGVQIGDVLSVYWQA